MLKSVERYRLPRYRDLAPVFFFLGIFGIGIGMGFGIDDSPGDEPQVRTGDD